MGYTKTTPKFNPFKTIVIGLIVMLSLIFLLAALDVAKENSHIVEGKYNIKVSNIINTKWYYCDSYKQENNTYKLYDEFGELKHEITITNGYLIEIHKK